MTLSRRGLFPVNQPAAAGCWARPLRANITGMTKATEAILADALRLDTESRAQLAAELLASLDGPSDPDADEAWRAEIAQRVADLEADKAKLESWEDVKQRIEKSMSTNSIRMRS